MTILRGMAVTGDVQQILFNRDYLENDLNNSDPGSEQAEYFIDFTMDGINAVLGTVGYQLPITVVESPIGYWAVRDWNALAAAELMERRSGGKDRADELKEQVDAIRAGIIDHSYLLPDVPGVPTEADLSQSGTSELRSDGTQREPFFTRDQLF